MYKDSLPLYIIRHDTFVIKEINSKTIPVSLTLYV